MEEHGKYSALFKHITLILLGVGMVVSTALWAGNLQSRSASHDVVIVDHEVRINRLEMKEQELRTTLQGMKELLQEIRSDVKEMKRNGGKK